MAPSSKSEKARDKYKSRRKQKGHVVKLLMHGRVSGQFSQRLFRKLPPRVCVPLKNIISEEILRSHIFLGFTKCGRYVLSYTSNCGEDDDFSFYTYQLYWWEFNLHKRLRQVRHVRLFGGEEIYSELYLTVCEWPNDHSKIVIFGFTRSSSSILANFMMSDENNRDIYITIASMPPPKPCPHFCSVSSASNISKGECLEHSYVINSRYQVVYPFPTFQPAFQLKKDQVILLNTSYSLVACGISLWPYEDDKVQLPFTVTDLKGQNLQLVTGPYNGQQGVCVEQLTLDFEYLINEVIRRDAAWTAQFCSFSDYDVVILEQVCPETNVVVINIGLLLLAFSKSDKEHCPNTYHSNLQVSWDLNTGVCCTMGVGELTEVKGQTGSVWSSYRKSCVNTVMKWLVPERSSRYINRMTNEALHKSSLQVLADGDRCTWIVL
uniref:DDB1 and CUL4 associated factor 15 n=1 Tax=Cynoglossus semilaevis TaxID=244447 RepID=A0A3P8VZW0_CYNSE